MEFSFGIITAGNNDEAIQQIVRSIEAEEIPNYEIIIVGDSAIAGQHITVIPFDETIKRGWITRKKNLLCQAAKYENIVLLHDYVCLNRGWYKGFQQFGNDFSYCVTPIVTLQSTRFRDFCIYVECMPPVFKENCLLPYSYKPIDKIRKLMYISGTYYVIKKRVALEYPLNENLVHGVAEDVELSQRLSTNGIYIECNPFSSVSLLRDKQQAVWENEMTEEHLELLESFTEEILEEIFLLQKRQIRYHIFTISGVTYPLY